MIAIAAVVSELGAGSSIEEGLRREVGGHRGKAAALLKVDPKTLYRKIIAYRITAEEWK